MIGLIRKDFTLNRKTFLPWIGMILVYSVMAILASNYLISSDALNAKMGFTFASLIVTIFSFACAGSMQAFLIQTDQGKKSKFYFCSTPVGIKGIVASKYYECFLVALGAYVYCEIFDLLLSVITGILIQKSLIHVLLVFLLMVLQSLTLPFYVRFGNHGAHIRTAILLIVFSIAIIYGLFGDISFFMQGEGFAARVQELMAHADNESVMAFILGVDYPKLAAMLLSPHLAMGGLYLSYRISCAIFRKGVNSYEA